MNGMQVYTCLDARLPRPIALPTQARLWVVAPNRIWASRLLQDRGIAWQEQSFAGPVQIGAFMHAMGRRGLLQAPAVYAYPVPHTPDMAVLRVDSPGQVTPVAVMRDLLGSR
jgi:hypothetical protein